ncbi:butyrophilin 2 [Labeo rohita]|uniref:Butyrophilin 2 n=1 Tax=Labeo rohita TaxID=84645 RepID=A0A498MRA5_LABRO|nr:butyrophilin 2 [Labeo rohita]RXN39075.1 butyrophilin 2 [Labeo rohita]
MRHYQWRIWRSSGKETQRLWCICFKMIQHGNFSLLLRAEDKGQYRCKVYSDKDSGENVVEIKLVVRLRVSGLNHPLSSYEGEDLTLSCSVDSHIPPEEIKEVSWKKTDKNGETLVLLFQYNEIIIPDQYKDRAEFITNEIPKGNFALRLKNIRAEDGGVYMCLVFAGDFSGHTTVEVKIRFVVQSPSDPLVVPLGGSVVLPCSVDMPLPVEDLEVQWKRDPETLVHLFQDAYLRVSGSNHPLSSYEGEDLTLSCSVDSHIPPEEFKEVSWKKTDKNGETLVLLFQYNEIIIPDQYKDRAEFITNEIPKGNFALRLKNIRAEDGGVYMCLVFAGGFFQPTQLWR